MIMSIATSFDLKTTSAHWWARPLVLATGCTALADWLFYGWDVGVSLALFLGVVGIVAIFGNRVRIQGTTRIALAAVLIASLLPLIEQVDLLSVTVSMLAATMSIIAMTSRQPAPWRRRLFEAITIPFRGPFRFAADMIGALRHMEVWTPAWLGWLVAWIVPLTVFAVFLALFTSANPLIEKGLMQIDLWKIIAWLSPWRMIFWLFIISMIWPLILRREKTKPAATPEPVAADAEPPSSDFDYLLGAQAITRSLVLFNVLFALQSSLDLTYLWGGATLPDGLTYATYAHRGAYPLIATALLAAAFVLVAMRSGGPAKASRLIRPLVLLFIAQNVLLVVSSIFRLDLYIAVYSLTYLRVAAFVWMGLVAIGLILILVQILRRKSNGWLLTANAISLAVVLYGCCFLNTPWLVATYDVEHSREVSGKGQNLDWRYIRCLGPQVLPAVERHWEKFPMFWSTTTCPCLSNSREFFVPSKNWRDWSFRAWRLKQYFANNPFNSLTPPTGGHG
jgi:hypothetical protein